MPEPSITLKEYLEAHIASLREVLESRFSVLELHLREFEERILKRLDTANGQVAAISKRVDVLEGSKTYERGALWAFALVLTVLFSVATMLMKLVWK